MPLGPEDLNSSLTGVTLSRRLYLSQPHRKVVAEGERRCPQKPFVETCPGVRDYP